MSLPSYKTLISLHYQLDKNLCISPLLMLIYNDYKHDERLYGIIVLIKYYIKIYKHIINNNCHEIKFNINDIRELYNQSMPLLSNLSYIEFRTIYIKLFLLNTEISIYEVKDDIKNIDILYDELHDIFNVFCSNDDLSGIIYFISQLSYILSNNIEYYELVCNYLLVNIEPIVKTKLITLRSYILVHLALNNINNHERCQLILNKFDETNNYQHQFENEFDKLINTSNIALYYFLSALIASVCANNKKSLHYLSYLLPSKLINLVGESSSIESSIFYIEGYSIPNENYLIFDSNYYDLKDISILLLSTIAYHSKFTAYESIKELLSTSFNSNFIAIDSLPIVDFNYICSVFEYRSVIESINYSCISSICTFNADSHISFSNLSLINDLELKKWSELTYYFRQCLYFGIISNNSKEENAILNSIFNKADVDKVINYNFEDIIEKYDNFETKAEVFIKYVDILRKKCNLLDEKSIISQLKKYFNDRTEPASFVKLFELMFDFNFKIATLLSSSCSEIFPLFSSVGSSNLDELLTSNEVKNFALITLDLLNQQFNLYRSKNLIAIQPNSEVLSIRLSSSLKDPSNHWSGKNECNQLPNFYFESIYYLFTGYLSEILGEFLNSKNYYLKAAYLTDFTLNSHIKSIVFHRIGFLNIQTDPQHAESHVVEIIRALELSRDPLSIIMQLKLLKRYYENINDSQYLALNRHLRYDKLFDAIKTQ